MKRPMLLITTLALSLAATAGPAHAEIIVLGETITASRNGIAARILLSRAVDLEGSDAVGYYFGADPATFDPVAALTAPELALRTHELQVGRMATLRLGPGAGVDPTPGADGLGPVAGFPGLSRGPRPNGTFELGFFLSPGLAGNGTADLVSGRPYALYTFEGSVPTLARTGLFPVYQADFAAIPEPASLAMAALGLTAAGLLAARHRRRRATAR